MIYIVIGIMAIAIISINTLIECEEKIKESGDNEWE